MTTITASFDPADYKLMPRVPTKEMLKASEMYAYEYEYLLASVPGELDGVVLSAPIAQQDGAQPVAWMKTDADGENYFVTKAPEGLGDWRFKPLYTHPAQQDGIAIVKEGK